MIQELNVNINPKPIDTNLSEEVANIKELIFSQKAIKVAQKKALSSGNVIHDEAKRKSVAIVSEINRIIDTTFAKIKEAIEHDKTVLRVPVTAHTLEVIEMPSYKKNPLINTLFNPILDLPNGASMDNPLSEFVNDLMKADVRVSLGFQPAEFVDGAPVQEYAFINLTWN